EVLDPTVAPAHELARDVRGGHVVRQARVDRHHRSGGTDGCEQPERAEGRDQLLHLLGPHFSFARSAAARSAVSGRYFSPPSARTCWPSRLSTKRRNSRTAGLSGRSAGALTAR